jgi:hypothetical protein
VSLKGTPLLLLAAIAALVAAQEPTVLRLRDAVGDTISRAERDSFHLFPNTTGFRSAVILDLPGSQFFAKVAQADGDTLVVPVYYRILPGQMERIRFLIDYRDFIAEQQKVDTTVAPSLKAFWREVESRPLREIASGNIEPHPENSPTAPSITTENRYHMTVMGATAGSALGGCVGSWAGIEVVDNVASTNCLDQSITVPVYSVNQPVFWTTACCLTALGTTAGYAAGDRLDRMRPAALPLPEEGKEWRTSCAIGAVIPGLVLGTGFFLLAGPLHYGRTELLGDIPNARTGMTVLPMALTGMCIAVEVTTIGYYVGRVIDRQNAEKAERKRRESGR